MSTELNDIVFVGAFSDLQKKMNETAHSKGWYESEVLKAIRNTKLATANDPWASDKAELELMGIEDARRIALMHSELSEALEGLRHGNKPSDHIPEFSAVEEEYADVIIRIMDHAQERGWRIAEAMIAKAAFNKTRSHRHGGKKF